MYVGVWEVCVCVCLCVCVCVCVCVCEGWVGGCAVVYFSNFSCCQMIVLNTITAVLEIRIRNWSDDFLKIRYFIGY